MYHTSKKKSTNDNIRKRFARLLSVIILIFPPVIYVVLTKIHSNGSYLYSIPHLIPVIIISAIVSLGVFLGINILLRNIITQDNTPVINEETTDFSSDVDEESSSGITYENGFENAYPELFNDNEIKSSEPFHVDLSNILDSNEYSIPEQPTEDDTETAWNDFISSQKEDELSISRDLYDNVESTLPDDYISVRSNESEEVSEIKETEPKHLSKKSVIISMIICLIISITTSIVLSFSYTTIDKTMINTHSIFGNKTYLWSDISTFEISQTFNSEFKLSLTTIDNSIISIVPSAMFQSEEFDNDYTNDIYYICDLVEILEKEGAQKSVIDVEGIKKQYENINGSLPDYIEKIIK